MVNHLNQWGPAHRWFQKPNSENEPKMTELDPVRVRKIDQAGPWIYQRNENKNWLCDDASMSTAIFRIDPPLPPMSHSWRIQAESTTRNTTNRGATEEAFSALGELLLLGGGGRRPHMEALWIDKSAANRLSTQARHCRTPLENDQTRGICFFLFRMPRHRSSSDPVPVANSGGIRQIDITMCNVNGGKWVVVDPTHWYR